MEDDLKSARKKAKYIIYNTKQQSFWDSNTALHTSLSLKCFSPFMHKDERFRVRSSPSSNTLEKQRNNVILNKYNK